MLLTFSKTQFEPLIKKGIKIHSIRADKHNRWQPGMSIQFWMGNPRNVKNNPYQFGTGYVSMVRNIEIFPNLNIIGFIGCKMSDEKRLNFIAKSDGFKDWDEMKEFFKEDFTGKLIYWEKCVWKR